jgi:prevent-host-death family protein
MSEVGIRALKQNASAVVARAEAGEVVTVTDRGRPVALLTALAASPLERALVAGLARGPLTPMNALGPPQPGPNLSDTLRSMRESARY